jgi:hypothetical protein
MKICLLSCVHKYFRDNLPGLIWSWVFWLLQLNGILIYTRSGKNGEKNPCHSGVYWTWVHHHCIQVYYIHFAINTDGDTYVKLIRYKIENLSQNSSCGEGRKFLYKKIMSESKTIYKSSVLKIFHVTMDIYNL